MKKLVIALMVTATSAIALAQTAGIDNSHRHGHRGGFHELSAKLNLTTEQKQQIKDIRTAERERNKQLYSGFHAKVQEFRSLKAANDPRSAGVKAELEAMKPQLKAAREASHEAMLGILTPDQRAQLEAARQSRGFINGDGHGRAAAMAQKLNLTDAQKAELKQLRATAEQQNAPLFAGARAKRQELRALTLSNDPKAADVKAELDALRPQLKAARAQQRAAFLNVLTPEQRAQLEQLKTEQHSNRRSSR